MGIETLLPLAGSVIGSMSASDAADAQAAGTAAGVAENRRQFDLTRSDYAPGRNIGNNALRRLAALYGLSDGGQAVPQQQIEDMLRPQFTTAGGRVQTGSGDTWDGTYTQTPSTFNQAGFDSAVQQRLQSQQATTPQVYNDGLDAPIEMDPGYQFGLDQGNQALDRKVAAAGGRVSGAALKGAQRFGVDYATTGYNAAYQRRQDRINRLQALAGIGQTATAGSAQAGDAAAARNANLYSAQGNAAGAANLAQGNIWGNTANQLGAMAQRGFGSQPSGPTNAQLAQTYGYG